MKELSNYNVIELKGRKVKLLGDKDGFKSGTIGEITNADISHDNISVKFPGKLNEITVSPRQVDLLPNSIPEYSDIITSNLQENEELQEKIKFMEEEKLEIFDERKFLVTKVADKIKEADGDKDKIRQTLAEYILQ